MYLHCLLLSFVYMARTVQDTANVACPQMNNAVSCNKIVDRQKRVNCRKRHSGGLECRDYYYSRSGDDGNETHDPQSGNIFLLQR